MMKRLINIQKQEAIVKADGICSPSLYGSPWRWSID